MGRIKVETNISYDKVKKSYYVCMDYGKDVFGKRIKKYKTCKSKKEARRLLVEFKAQKNKGEIVMPNELIVEGWSKYWLGIKKMHCAKTTLYGYSNIINKHIIPSFGNKKLSDVDTAMVNNYLQMKVEEGLSKSTVRKHQDLLKTMFEQAVSEDKIIKNPISKSVLIKKESVSMNFYTVEQLKDLFRLVEGHWMELPIKLGGMLGLRRGEICGLKWENVDLSSNVIVIKTTRTQSGKDYVEKEPKTESSVRTLHIPDDIIKLLVEKRKQQPFTEFVLSWEKNGKPIRPNYVSDTFLKIIRDNDLPMMRFHDLRHSFASVSNELGIGIHTISKTLGHSKIDTTSSIYTHVFDKTHKDAIDIVADVFNK